MGRYVSRIIVRGPMETQLRRVIFVILIFLLFDNQTCSLTPELESVTVAEVTEANDTRTKLLERREELVKESMAYALHKVAKIQGSSAREIVRLVLQETLLYEDVDPLVVLGLIVTESLGNPQAISHVGARGLMQIMPSTGKFIAANYQEKWEGTHSLYEVARNIRYGIWYVNHLQELFPGQDQAVLAAYNWGMYNIRYRQERGRVLPKTYPNKVQNFKKQLQKEMYAFYRTHFWRSQNLDQDPSYFQDNPDELKTSSRHRELLVHDAEGQLLPKGSRVQRMSRLLPGGS